MTQNRKLQIRYIVNFVFCFTILIIVISISQSPLRTKIAQTFFTYTAVGEKKKVKQKV